MIQSLKKRTRNAVYQVMNMTNEQRLIASGLLSSGMLIVVAGLFVRERVNHHADIINFNKAWNDLFSDSTVFLKEGDLNAVLNGTPHEFEFVTGDVLYLVNDK